MKEKSVSDAQSYYLSYDVENRIKRDKAHYVEFILSISTLNKYVKPRQSVIDIGCGTGNYSIELADKVKEVLATDLMDNLLNVLQNKIKQKQCRNISCLCANVLDLPQKVHKKYDLILCMGPLYHLNVLKQRRQCYENLKQIAAKNAVFVLTYISSFACLSNVLKGKMKFSDFWNKYQKTHFYIKPFYFTSPDFMEKELKNNSFEILEHVSLDPISSFMYESVNTFSDAQYNDFIETIKTYASNQKLLHMSSHNMIVAQLEKVNEKK